MKLVWHAERMLERDWLLDILGDLVEEEIPDPGLNCLADDAIHVMSGNFLTASRATFAEYFRICRAQCRNIVLFHASDEWLSGGYEIYQHFDHVIRTYESYLTRHPGVLTIPLGYPNGTVRYSGPPRAPHKYAWSFAGEFKASRIAMRRAFCGLEPKVLYDTSSRQIGKEEFNRILQNTIFSPCPMGNVVLETWRLYEALELGCIPLIERRDAIDYYGNLLGNNPIPSFRTWQAARHYAENLLADERRLTDTQRSIEDWWIRHKAFVRAQVRATLKSPSRSKELQHFAKLPRNQYAAVYQTLRAAELLRHQSMASLWHRVRRFTG